MTPLFTYRRAVLVPLLAAFFLGVGSTLAAVRFGSDIFSDVPEGSYYDEELGALYDAGILTGDPSGTFRPGDPVNRAELAVALGRLRAEILGEGVTTARSSRRSSRESDTNSSVASSSAQASSQQSITTAGALRFTQGAYTVVENAGSVTITVSRAGGARGVAEVSYILTAGTATAGSDFTQTNGKVTFGDGVTSQTFTVQILNDSNSEGNETVMIALQSPTNTAILTVPSTATLTIVDDETSGGSSRSSSPTQASVSSNPAGTLGLSATMYSMAENYGSVIITVERTGGSTGVVGINYATSNGSGNSSDYGPVSGTLTFNAGETSKTFSIPIVDDSSIDGSKTANITLSNPTGGPSLATTSASLTILDNESVEFGSGSLRFSKTDYEVTEKEGKAAIVIQRTGGAKGTATVFFEVIVGTAIPGQDYTATSGTLTFLQGESAKIYYVPILKDSTSDSGEAATLNLSNPIGATFGSPTQGTLTIYD